MSADFNSYGATIFRVAQKKGRPDSERPEYERKDVLLRRLGPSCRLLFLLQLLPLLVVFLLQLLCLLLMPLLHMLHSYFIGFLLRESLVFLLLLLLELLPFLFLLCELFVLLLLVLLVQLLVPSIGDTRPWRRRQVANMDGRSRNVVLGTAFRTQLISATFGWWSIGCPCLFGGHDGAVSKISGPWCCCDRWLAHVH